MRLSLIVDDSGSIWSKLPKIIKWDQKERPSNETDRVSWKIHIHRSLEILLRKRVLLVLLTTRKPEPAIKLRWSQNMLPGGGDPAASRCSCIRWNSGCTSPDPSPRWRYAFYLRKIAGAPRGVIPNGKPFHHPCPGYGSDCRNFECKCSDQSVPKVQRSF